MTKKIRKCKCGRKAVVYAYFYNKLVGHGVHIHSCADHYEMDLKYAKERAFPYKLDTIDK